MKQQRFKSGLLAIFIFIVAVLGLGMWYSREMKRLEQEKRYAELRASSVYREVKITIPEGWRREQIAALLEKNAVTVASDFLDLTRNDEGRLFPDTYLFYPATPAKEVRDKLLATYRRKAPEVDARTLAIAAIVEREAQRDDERAQIAGVYWNRLEINMRLQADPTVQYAKDTLAFNRAMAIAKNRREEVAALRDFKFWQPITRLDYDTVDSPYNTYRNAGVTPNPICNPGVKSLEAALHPAQHDYLFFFHRSDGTAVFSRTLDEHLKGLRN